jgi:hypothetical protein
MEGRARRAGGGFGQSPREGWIRQEGLAGGAVPVPEILTTRSMAVREVAQGDPAIRDGDRGLEGRVRMSGQGEERDSGLRGGSRDR